MRGELLEKCCSYTWPFCLVQALTFYVKSGAHVCRDKHPQNKDCFIVLFSWLCFQSHLHFGLVIPWYAVRTPLLLKRFNKYLSGIFCCFQQECWFKFSAHHNLINGSQYIYFEDKNSKQNNIFWLYIYRIKNLT